MSIEPETFLSFSSTAWSAISSMATVSAVAVALLLPFYYEKKKQRNLSKLIKNELKRNINLLKKANTTKDKNLNGNTITKLSIMCAMLQHLSLNIWNDNKQTIAEISAIGFLKFSSIVKLIEEIKTHAIEINKNKGYSLYSALLEDEVERCLQMYKKNGKIINA